MGSVNGWLVFGVSTELLEGEGGIQAATRADSLNAASPFSSIFVLFVWLAIRCSAVEFAWSRDLHELLFLATCTSVPPVLHGTRAPLWSRICAPGCSGQQKPSAWGKEGCSDRSKAAEIRGKHLQGCATASGFCVFILCADFSSQHDFVKATSSC